MFWKTLRKTLHGILLVQVAESGKEISIRQNSTGQVGGQGGVVYRELDLILLSVEDMHGRWQGGDLGV
jgi:hypothetical protein